MIKETTDKNKMTLFQVYFRSPIDSTVHDIVVVRAKNARDAVARAKPQANPGWCAVSANISDDESSMRTFTVRLR